MWSFIFDAYSDKSDFVKYTDQISLKCCIGYCMAVCLTEDTWYLLFFSFFLLIVLCWVIPLAGVCWLSGHQAKDQLYQRLSVCPSCLHTGQVTNNSPYTFLSGETSIFLDNTFVGKVSLGWAHWRTYLWNLIKKVQKGFPFPAASDLVHDSFWRQEPKRRDYRNMMILLESLQHFRNFVWNLSLFSPF